MSDADRNRLQQSLRELREGAIGVLTGVEAEIARLAHRALDGVGVKGEGDAAARIRETVGELIERAKKNRDDLEDRVDQGVKAAVARVGRPLAKELEALRVRLETVQRRVDALARRGTGPKE